MHYKLKLPSRIIIKQLTSYWIDCCFHFSNFIGSVGATRLQNNSEQWTKIKQAEYKFAPQHSQLTRTSPTERHRTVAFNFWKTFKFGLRSPPPSIFCNFPINYEHAQHLPSVWLPGKSWISCQESWIPEFPGRNLKFLSFVLRSRFRIWMH